MDILRTYIRKYLRHNRSRTLLSIFSIALAAAMIFSLSAIVTSIYLSINETLVRATGNYHTVFKDVSPEFESYLDLNMQVKEEMKVQHYGVSYLSDSMSADKAYLRLVGFSPSTFKNLDVNLVEGRFPQANNEIIVSQSLQYEGKVKMLTGRQVVLNLGRRISDEGEILDEQDEIQPNEYFVPTYSKTYEVVGVFETAGFDFEYPYYSIITTYDSSLALPLDVYLLYQDIQDTVQTTGSLSELFAGEYSSYSYNEKLLKYNNVFDENVVTIQTVLLFVAAFLFFLFIAVQLIFSSFANAYQNREKHIAIFKSIGATPSQIRMMIVYEGLVILFFALPLGLLFGYVFITLIYTLVNTLLSRVSLNGIQLSLQYGPFLLLISVLLTLVISLLSMRLAAKRTVRKSISTTLLSNDEVDERRKPYLDLTNHHLGIANKLTLKHLKQNRKPYRRILLLMVIITSLFVSTRSLFDYMRQGAIFSAADVNYDVKAEIYNERTPTRLITRLKQTEGYSSMVISEALSVLTYDLSGFSDAYLEMNNYNNSQTLTLIAYSDEVLEAYIQRTGAVQNLDELKDVEHPTLLLLNQKYDPDRHTMIDIMDKMSISSLQTWYPLEQTILEEVTVIPVSQPLSGMSVTNKPQLIVSRTLMEQIIAQCNPDDSFMRNYTIYFQSSDPNGLERTLNMMTQSDRVASFNVVNVVAQQLEDRTIKALLEIMIYGYLLLIALMGMMAVLNISSVNFEYRRKEFVLYRLLGLRMRTVRRMIFSELLWYVLKIMMASTILSLAADFLIYQYFFKSLGLHFYLNKESILYCVIFYFGAVVLLTFYASMRIGQSKLTDEVKNEISLL